MVIGNYPLVPVLTRLVVIPYGDISIPFYLRALTKEDYEALAKILPEPTAPIVHKADGSSFPDLKDSTYQAAVMRRNIAIYHYWFLRSIDYEKTQLKFDTVDMNDPDTWGNYESEMRAHGFTPSAIAKLREEADELNLVTDESVRKARERFLRENPALTAK
jgi:hypothetical protein